MNVFHLNRSRFRRLPGCAAIVAAFWLGMAEIEGAAKSPPGVEENYGKSQLEWVQQTYDGRMDYGAVATSTVQDLLGWPAMTLRDWVSRHREELLAASS